MTIKKIHRQTKLETKEETRLRLRAKSLVSDNIKRRMMAMEKKIKNSACENTTSDSKEL